MVAVDDHPSDGVSVLATVAGRVAVANGKERFGVPWNNDTDDWMVVGGSGDCPHEGVDGRIVCHQIALETRGMAVPGQHCVR